MLFSVSSLKAEIIPKTKNKMPNINQNNAQLLSRNSNNAFFITFYYLPPAGHRCLYPSMDTNTVCIQTLTFFLYLPYSCRVHYYYMDSHSNSLEANPLLLSLSFPISPSLGHFLFHPCLELSYLLQKFIRLSVKTYRSIINVNKCRRLLRHYSINNNMILV